MCVCEDSSESSGLGVPHAHKTVVQEAQEKVLKKLSFTSEKTKLNVLHQQTTSCTSTS